MYKIILDCDLMRYPDSGLYHYYLNLGTHVQRILEKMKAAWLLRASRREKSFGPNAACITERKWHEKFFRPYLWDCDIWHAPFQSGRVVPKPNGRIKVLLTIHDLNCLHEGRTAKNSGIVC